MIEGIFFFIIAVLVVAAFVGLLLMPAYLVIAFCRALWRDAHPDVSSPNR